MAVVYGIEKQASEINAREEASWQTGNSSLPGSMKQKFKQSPYSLQEKVGVVAVTCRGAPGLGRKALTKVSVLPQLPSPFPFLGMPFSSLIHAPYFYHRLCVFVVILCSRTQEFGNLSWYPVDSDPHL